MKYNNRRRAFMKDDREYESNINLFRVANDLTIAELSKRAGVAQTYISALANGSMSPLQEKSGAIRKSAQKLCEFFNVELHELFPRYACALDRGLQHEILPYESYSEGIASGFVDKLILHDYVSKLLLSTPLTRKEEVVLELYFTHDMTMAEVAQTISRSTELVRQRISHALRKLRTTLMQYDSEVFFPVHMLRTL